MVLIRQFKDGCDVGSKTGPKTSFYNIGEPKNNQYHANW